MSTKCSYRVDGKDMMTDWDSKGQQVKVPKKRPCGKEPKVFIRVDYDELIHWYRKEGKFHDVFGFCPEHGALLAEGPARWNKKIGNYRHELVSRLRGNVKTVSVLDAAEIDDPKEMAKREDKLRHMTAIKGNIKRLMGQRNTSKLTLDDWEQVFDECRDEYAVESVMESSPFVTLLLGSVISCHGSFTATRTLALAAVMLVLLVKQWRSAGKTMFLPR